MGAKRTVAACQWSLLLYSTRGLVNEKDMGDMASKKRKKKNEARSLHRQ